MYANKNIARWTVKGHLLLIVDRNYRALRAMDTIDNEKAVNAKGKSSKLKKAALQAANDRIQVNAHNFTYKPCRLSVKDRRAKYSV